MSLQNEIREVLYTAGGPLHPEIIRMRVLAARTDNKESQDLKTFANVMSSMEDVKSIQIGKLHYRMFKADAKHSMRYHISGILSLITAIKFQRVGEWKSMLQIQLSSLKSVIVKRQWP